MTSGKTLRPYSASEIARCPEKFDVWAEHQACTLAALSDLPTSMKRDVQYVFNVTGRIPKSYVLPGAIYDMLHEHFPSLHDFLLLAYEEDPTLFCDGEPKHRVPLGDLCGVQSACETLQGMLKSSVRWSEADFAGKVYSLIRSAAVSKSRLQLQVPISLPHPPSPAHSGAEERILAAQSVIPDASIFVPSTDSLVKLSQGKNSAFNVLKEKARPRGGRFRHQAALTARFPDKEVFAFASSLWEDKKPDQTHVDNAWRQNRMATAAAARQCHAFRVKAPVIGLVWGEGKVRAHIDWAGEQGGHVNVYSAPYAPQEASGAGSAPGSRAGSHRESGVSRVSTTVSALSAVSAAPEFHTWDLSKPAAAIAVHLIVRNLDAWTKRTFSKRVVQGVREVAADDKAAFVPWKHAQLVTKSPASENTRAASARVKKQPQAPAEIEGPQPDATVPAAPATRRRRSGLRPRK